MRFVHKLPVVIVVSVFLIVLTKFFILSDALFENINYIDEDHFEWQQKDVNDGNKVIKLMINDRNNE